MQPRTYTASEVIDAIMITAEVCGTQISDAAAKAMVMHLKPYGGDAIMKALHRCQREIKGRFALADVLRFIEAKDGRPSDEEAWGICYAYITDENRSIMVTAEIDKGAEACRDLLLEARDRVAARMAFLEAYRAAVHESREQGLPVRWRVSVSQNKLDVADVVKQALVLGRIDKPTALMLLPNAPQTDDVRFEIEHGRVMTLEDKRQGEQQLKKVKQMLIGVSKPMPSGDDLSNA